MSLVQAGTTLQMWLGMKCIEVFLLKRDKVVEQWWAFADTWRQDSAMENPKRCTLGFERGKRPVGTLDQRKGSVIWKIKELRDSPVQVGTIISSTLDIKWDGSFD